MTPHTPTCIETSTGRYVDLLAPDPATICLADIAAHLSRIGRFNGACRRYYSVAEHACLVADRVRSQGAGPRTILRALHHDSAEYAIGDRTRPHQIALARVCEPATFRGDAEIEERIAQAIVEALALPLLTVADAAQIKAADNWALAAEAYHLLPSRGRGWVCDGLYDPDDPRNPPMVNPHPPHSMTPAGAEALFISLHNRWAQLLAELVA